MICIILENFCLPHNCIARLLVYDVVEFFIVCEEILLRCQIVGLGYIEVEGFYSDKIRPNPKSKSGTNQDLISGTFWPTQVCWSLDTLLPLSFSAKFASMEFKRFMIEGMFSKESDREVEIRRMMQTLGRPNLKA